jgi:hypothetical protein
MRKTKILLIVITFETLIISIFFVERILHKSDFVFKKNSEIPFTQSFSFFSKKSNETHGFIAIENDGDFASIFLSDNAGRLITVGFDDGHIISYVILDKGTNYEMQTFFVKNSSSDENKILLSRQESFNSIKQYYIIDYNTSPFFFASEFPMKFEKLEIDATSTVDKKEKIQ